MSQLDLFTWSENRPSNLIDRRELFQRKIVSLLGAMLDGESLPEKNGDVVQLAQRRCGKIGGEAA